MPNGIISPTRALRAAEAARTSSLHYHAGVALFPLDAVRNAPIDRSLEPLLEDVREDLIRFPFPADIGGAEAVVEAFDLARPRLNVLLQQLRDLDGARGADISTGLGFLPVLLARCGLDVTATEHDRAICAYPHAKGIRVDHYSIGRNPPPIPAASLQFVVFAEVLEHVKRAPVSVLRDVTSLLRPGGILLLTTPNIARLAHIDALAAGDTILEPFPAELPLDQDPTDHLEHVHEYSIREVVESIEAAGLMVERVLMTGWGPAGYEPLPNPFANEIIVVVASAPPPEGHGAIRGPFAMV
jgi:SAM-dependent methyltransferase